MEQPWRRLLADVLGRELSVLPDAVAARASARGAAFLAGIAAGAYEAAADTLAFAPEPVGTVQPAGAGAYEDAFARYKDLYPALRGNR
jgi:xylulokinase